MRKYFVVYYVVNSNGRPIGNVKTDEVEFHKPICGMGDVRKIENILSAQAPFGVPVQVIRWQPFEKPE